MEPGPKMPIPPKLPFKVRLLLAAHIFSVEASRRSNLTVNRTVSNLFDPKSPPSSKPINGVSSFDVIINPNSNLWLRLYTPRGHDTTTLPVIVYFHGGGFCFMAANSMHYDDFCRLLAGKIPALVLSVNYRLAPEHRCPTQYEDGLEALKFIDTVMDFGSFNANADLSRCFIGGDSAGGNLAHHVVLKSGEYSLGKIKIVGLIAIQPFFGGEEVTKSEKRLAPISHIKEPRTRWMWKAFLPNGSDRNHKCANVFGPNAMDLSAIGFPPTLIIMGGLDPLQDWQKMYHQGLIKYGKQVELIEYPNARHGFYCFSELPESTLLITDVKDFVQKQLVKC